MEPIVRSIPAHHVQRPDRSEAKPCTRLLLLRRFKGAVWFFASLSLCLSQIVSTYSLTTASAQTKRSANPAATSAEGIPVEPPQDAQTGELLPASGDDPAAAADAQEAQATEELQQLIAQAQECLTNLSASKDKAEAILRALQALTSALERKASLFEEGKIAEAAEADQEVNANQQQLEQAVDESVGELESVDPPLQEIPTPGGESKLDRVMGIIDFAFGMVERIVDLRDRFRGYSTGFPTVDPHQPGIGENPEEVPSEEEMVLVSGQSWREEAAPQVALTVERPQIATAGFRVQTAEGLSAFGSGLHSSNGWLQSRAATVDQARPLARRRVPVAGAEVVEPDSGISTQTEGRGFYTLRVPARSRKLVVRMGGREVARVAINLAHGRATVKDIQLGSDARTAQGARVLPSTVAVDPSAANTGTLKGQVLNAQGQPLALALVDLQSQATARSNSQGRFNFIKVPAGPQRLTVSTGELRPRTKKVSVSAGRITESTIRFDSKDTVTRQNDRLIVPGAGTILRGTVLDNQDRPVGGAKISVVGVNASSTIPSVHVKGDGSYEVRDLKPGSYRVLVDKPGFTAANQKVSLRNGGSEQLNFRFNKDTTSPFRPGVEDQLARRFGEIQGKVRNRSGDPIPNATIELKGNAQATSPRPARTDRNGEYVIRALAGQYELKVKATNFQEASETVALWAGDGTTKNFDLKPAPGLGPVPDRHRGSDGISKSGTLTGHIADKSSHAPTAGATVSAGERSTRTDQAGNFTIANIEPRKYQVNVSRPGYSLETKTVDVKDGKPTRKDFGLKPVSGSGSAGERVRGADHTSNSATLLGHVSDKKSHAAIQDATVLVGGRSGRTDQAGNFTIANIEPRKYQVNVSRPGYSLETKTVDVKDGKPTRKDFGLKPVSGSGSAGERARGADRLSNSGTLLGHVSEGKNHASIAGATVSAGGRTARTDHSGNFSISGLEARRYEVKVYKTGYSTKTRSVEVKADAPARNHFRLEANRSLDRRRIPDKSRDRDSRDSDKRNSRGSGKGDTTTRNNSNAKRSRTPARNNN